MPNKSILLIGLKPEVVDFKQWPHLSVEKLNASFQQIINDLENLGYNAEWCLTDLGETAREVVQAKLEEANYAVVVIGAGLRTDPNLLELFEAVINQIHELSPKSKVAFNSNPGDTIEAVQRWI